MAADTQDDAVAALTEAGYWEEPVFWRSLGGDDNNFATIGNQQSEAVAALIEKVVNSVDARLMNACLEAGLDPSSRKAPKSMREAVARFFEEKAEPDLSKDGRISSWPDDKATTEGRLLTVTATGHLPGKGHASLTIADQGEGQSPDRFPDTFVSLHRENKLRIHFVQGKFNMGGTGALQHCSGPHHLQLIVSRRNPSLLDDRASDRDRQWGFTIVRREQREGARSSVFTYLAPVGAQDGHEGGVLAFDSDSLPILPEASAGTREPYGRLAPYGSLIKLYEYVWKGTRSNIVSSGGALLRRIDVGLPELTLPVRVFECRSGYRGHSGSFSTNALGLAARLERDRAANLEEGFPLRATIQLRGKTLRVRTYAFKAGKAGEYRRATHGVVFAVNGQTHGTYSIDFFRRREVGMSYLADSLLVLVDCSEIDAHAREDLFMNSRDRLRDNELSEELEQVLASLVKNDATLRRLRNQRREAELAEKLADSKPLADALEELLRSSPTLAKLFLQGVHVPSPFPPATGAGRGETGAFEGKTYPTYFRFYGMKDGEPLRRDAQVGRRIRVTFETDAADDYFDRELDCGERGVTCECGGESRPVENFQVTGPSQGIVNLSLDLPLGVSEGEEVKYLINVTDPSRVAPFVNSLELIARPKREPTSGTRGKKRKSSNRGKGKRGQGTTLALPNIVAVSEEEWEQHGFDELTALNIKHAGADGDERDIFDFYVNIDNKYLRAAQKESKDDPKLLTARFQYSLALIGLALIQDGSSGERGSAQRDSDGSADEPVSREVTVDRTTRALAPVVLPLVDLMGALAVDDD